MESQVILNIWASVLKKYAPAKSKPAFSNSSLSCISTLSISEDCLLSCVFCCKSFLLTLVTRTLTWSSISLSLSGPEIKQIQGWVMVFIPTFHNISVISWQSVLLVEVTGVPGENHRPVTSHWQTYNVSGVHVKILTRFCQNKAIKIKFYTNPIWYCLETCKKVLNIVKFLLWTIGILGFMFRLIHNFETLESLIK